MDDASFVVHSAPENGHPSARRDHLSAGFTILEVMIALVILGVALAFLSGAITDSIARAERTKRDGLAANLADTILARLGRDGPMPPGASGGHEGELYWQMAVQPVSCSKISDAASSRSTMRRKSGG